MVDWPVWVDALEERNRMECRNSRDSLRCRRKRPSIHLHWNAGHGDILAEVSSECPEIIGGIVWNVSGCTDPAAVATSIAAASRFIVGSEATAAMVDANTVTLTPILREASRRADATEPDDPETSTIGLITPKPAWT
jgi:hypothetical protein